MTETATLSLRETADYLGLSYSTVYRLAQSGEILPGVPALKFRTAYRVPRAKLYAAVEGGES